MKYNLLLLFALFTAGITHAQEFKTPAANTKDSKLILENFRGDVPIEGYNGTEIIISSTDGDFQQNERTKGLKPIYAAGTDNTGLGLAFEKDGNKISFRCLLPITKSASYRVKVPENMAIEINSECGGGGNTNISGIKNEIDVKSCQDVTLKNVSGPIVVSTISGSVNVVFTELNKDKPISITSISGEVDVTIPAKTPFTLEMNTVSGNLYSDFELPATGNLRVVGGNNNARWQLNGGGVDVRLHSVSGNIYVRKS